MAHNKKSIKHNTTKYHIITIILIITISTIIFFNTFKNEFVYDDLALIVENMAIREWHNFDKSLFSIRPVRTLTHMIDYSIWQLNPFGYHLTNLILHILCTISLYFLLNLLFKNIQLSLIITLLFATHPIHTEAVTGITHRKEMLALLFYLLSFIFYLKKYQSSWFFGLAIISYTLALYSKEIAAGTLPIILLLYDICFKGDIRKKVIIKTLKRNIKYYLSYGIITGLVFLHTMKMSGVAQTFLISTSIQRVSHMETEAYLPILYTTLKALLIYIRLLFFPYNLCIDYTIPISKSIFDVSVLCSIGFLAILLIFMKKIFYFSKEIFFGILWFFINWLPISNIVPLTHYFVAERYMYVPSLGFCIILGVIINKIYQYKVQNVKNINEQILKPIFSILPPKIFAISVLVIILLTYSGLTIYRNFDWKDSCTLWSKTLQQNPRSVKAVHNLGVGYAEQGMHYKAIELYKKVIKLSPNFDKTYYNLGVSYKNIGLYDKAIVEYQKALKLNPNYDNAYMQLGIIYEIKGMYDEAIAQYQKALKINPNYFDVYKQLGIIYCKRGLYDKGIAAYKNALKIYSRDIELHNNLGIAYQKKGLYDKAISQFNKALKIDPNCIDTHTNLAYLYYKKGMESKAIEEIKKALSLPDARSDKKKYLQLLLQLLQNKADVGPDSTSTSQTVFNIKKNIQ